MKIFEKTKHKTMKRVSWNRNMLIFLKIQNITPTPPDTRLFSEKFMYKPAELNDDDDDDNYYCDSNDDVSE